MCHEAFWSEGVMVCWGMGWVSGFTEELEIKVVPHWVTEFILTRQDSHSLI